MGTSMLDRVWKTLDGKVLDDPELAIKNALKRTEGGKIVHIGSDSQQTGKHTQYVTVIVILDEGHGGRVFYTQERVPKIKSLRERLWKEAWMSVTLAMELTTAPDIGKATIDEKVDLTIHIDANPDKKFRSSEYVQELVGLVIGQGFKTLVKPQAWCAAHVADHVVKAKVLGGG